MNKIIKVILIVIFFVLLSWAVNLPFAKAGELKEPTITVPYTEEQMCRALLKAEICEMSREEQEKYFLEIFRALSKLSVINAFNFLDLLHLLTKSFVTSYELNFF